MDCYQGESTVSGRSVPSPLSPFCTAPPCMYLFIVLTYTCFPVQGLQHDTGIVVTFCTHGSIIKFDVADSGTSLECDTCFHLSTSKNRYQSTGSYALLWDLDTMVK